MQRKCDRDLGASVMVVGRLGKRGMEKENENIKNEEMRDGREGGGVAKEG